MLKFYAGFWDGPFRTASIEDSATNMTRTVVILLKYLLNLLPSSLCSNLQEKLRVPAAWRAGGKDEHLWSSRKALTTAQSPAGFHKSSCSGSPLVFFTRLHHGGTSGWCLSHSDMLLQRCSSFPSIVGPVSELSWLRSCSENPASLGLFIDLQILTDIGDL